MARDRIMLVVGLSCLAVAMALAAMSILGSRSRAPAHTSAVETAATPAPLVPVVAATKDIRRGEKIKEGAVSLLRLAGSAPAGSFGRIADVVGAVSLVDVKAHQLILRSMVLSQPGARPGLSALVPSGMRAVALRVNDVVAVGNFVRPDDRVDIELVVPADQLAKIQGKSVVGAHDSESRILLQDIAILSVGETLAVDQDHKAIHMQNLTVAVTPRQALEIALAKQVGQFYLSLRAPTDRQVSHANAIRSRQLVGGSPTPVATKTVPKRASRAVAHHQNRVVIMQGISESYQTVN